MIMPVKRAPEVPSPTPLIFKLPSRRPVKTATLRRKIEFENRDDKY
jgi:hypothetical protein